MPSDHDAYAALRHRDYRLLLGAGVLSAIGLEVLAVAIGWELYRRTSSAWALGLAGLAQFLPVLLLALPAGQAADRHSRKVLFQLAQALLALTSLGLTALSLTHGPVELMLACLLLIGVGRAFTAPARSSLLAQVVPAEALGNAVTWNSSGWQFANVTGPALGGLVLAVASPAHAYVVAAGCSLVCIFLLAPIQPVQKGMRPVTARSLDALLAGVQFVWRNDLLLAAITLDLFAVLLGGATALLPIFARDVLKEGPVGLGYLRAAPAVGAFLMAVVLAHRPPMSRPGVALLLAVTGFGVVTIAFGLSNSFYLSLLMLALSGALDNVSVVVRSTLMQMLTPDEMRGRVAAVNTVFISSSNELGAFESGATAALFGPVASVVGGGIGTILVAMLVGWCWPRLVRLEPLHTLVPHSASPPEHPEPPAAPG